jgi:hypothetical protein
MSGQGSSQAPNGQAVSTCILNNSYFTVAFVVAGTIFGVRKKSYRPLMAAGLLGAISDAAFGYFYSCRDIIDAYEKSRAAK